MQQLMRRNLLLISLDWNKAKDKNMMSLGTASLLANLEKARTSVIAKNLNSDITKEQVLLDILSHDKFSSSDVGIGAYIWNENFVQYITSELKRRQFKNRIILGGPQISYTK